MSGRPRSNDATAKTAAGTSVEPKTETRTERRKRIAAEVATWPPLTDAQRDVIRACIKPLGRRRPAS